MKQSTDPTPMHPVPDYDPNEESGPMTPPNGYKKGPNWKVIAIVAAIVLLLLAGGWKACHAQTISRPYHPTSISTMASGQYAWTHVEVQGTVAYVKAEEDGDTHIKLVNPSGAFIVCECTPKEPCAKPTIGRSIIVRGISRRDPEHGWYEVHPIENWRYAT